MVEPRFNFGNLAPKSVIPVTTYVTWEQIFHAFNSRPFIAAKKKGEEWLLDIQLHMSKWPSYGPWLAHTEPSMTDTNHSVNTSPMFSLDLCLQVTAGGNPGIFLKGTVATVPSTEISYPWSPCLAGYIELVSGKNTPPPKGRVAGDAHGRSWDVLMGRHIPTAHWASPSFSTSFTQAAMVLDWRPSISLVPTEMHPRNQTEFVVCEKTSSAWASQANPQPVCSAVD